VAKNPDYEVWNKHILSGVCEDPDKPKIFVEKNVRNHSQHQSYPALAKIRINRGLLYLHSYLLDIWQGHCTTFQASQVLLPSTLSRCVTSLTFRRNTVSVACTSESLVIIYFLSSPTISHPQALNVSKFGVDRVSKITFLGNRSIKGWFGDLATEVKMVCFKILSLFSSNLFWGHKWGKLFTKMRVEVVLGTDSNNRICFQSSASNLILFSALDRSLQPSVPLPHTRKQLHEKLRYCMMFIRWPVTAYDRQEPFSWFDLISRHD